MLKGLLRRKEKATTRNKRITKGKNLTGKGKHIVKVVDQPLIKLVEKLQDKRSKIICIYNKYLRDTKNKKIQNMMSKT